jgi:tetratricopeptide (TPR) repeat protein
LTSSCGVTWTSSFYPHFALKCGESHGTINSAQQSIFASLQIILRDTGYRIDTSLCKRIIKQLDRLLLDSRQDSLHMEMFHSGPTAVVTLEMKLKLAQCYMSMHETKAAEDIASEALQTAQETLGYLHPLTMQLHRAKLASLARLLQVSGNQNTFEIIPKLSTLVDEHVKVFGADHRETDFCRHALASVHIMNREFGQARQILAPLHNRMVETLGYASRVTQRVANSLASCANMQKDYDYAEQILNTNPGVVKAASETLEIDITRVSVEILHALSIFASVLGARDQDHRSEILHQRVIDGLMVLQGPKTRRVYESAINKGQALRDQSKYAEARKHYVEWLKKSNHHLGTDSKPSRKMRERLLDLDQREHKWKETSRNLENYASRRFSDWDKGLVSMPIGSFIIFAVFGCAWFYFL